MADCGCGNYGGIGKVATDAEIGARADAAKMQIQRCAGAVEYTRIIQRAYELPSPEDAVLYLEQQAEEACADQPLENRWKRQPPSGASKYAPFIIGGVVVAGVLALLYKKS